MNPNSLTSLLFSTISKCDDEILLEVFSTLKEPMYDDRDDENALTYDQYLKMLPKFTETPKTPKVLVPNVSVVPKVSVSKVSKSPENPEFSEMLKDAFTRLMTYTPHPYFKPTFPAGIKITIIMTLGYITANTGNPNVRLCAAAGLGIFALID